MIKAILFDLDGTITDTEKLYRRFYKQAFNHFGFDVTDEQILSLRSLGKPYCIDRFFEWFGDKLHVTELKQYRNKLMDDFIANNGIEVKKGMRELIIWLKENNYMVVLTTACDYKTASFRLNKIGLIKYFDHIICANDVKFGKPAPDTYLKAVNYLKLDPKECLAIEDSPNGVKSAVSAGLNTIMIPDQTPPTQDLLDLKIYVVKDGFELRDFIKNLK